ncbi:hypothetical protein SLS64_011654 [Diaporthe eres]|uniref:NAD dependent epimerase/dehydratase n=1 Tax=Diaporthe eres TaxID=83184 RepID=A0ABR1P7X3_DIAER
MYTEVPQTEKTGQQVAKLPCYADTYSRKPITDIFTKDTDVDKRGRKRTVPMKVLLLAVGRTGTASMRAAMQHLGYVETYHMMCASIENPPDALLWHDALVAKYFPERSPLPEGTIRTREFWDQLLGNCQAVCDWPACAFAEELMEVYPEAKVVLTGRDVDSWHKSTLPTVYWRATDHELRMLSNTLLPFGLSGSWAAQMYYPMLKMFFDTFFEGDFVHRGKDVYRRHYEKCVRLATDGGRNPGRLLEFRVQEGWEPLCNFLGERVPKAQKFPNVNDGSDFVSRSRRRNRNQMMNVAVRLLMWWVVVGFVCYVLMGMLTA